MTKKFVYIKEIRHDIFSIKLMQQDLPIHLIFSRPTRNKKTKPDMQHNFRDVKPLVRENKWTNTILHSQNKCDDRFSLENIMTKMENGS